MLTRWRTGFARRTLIRWVAGSILVELLDPIALGKTVNRMMGTRLVWWTERPLLRYAFGFCSVLERRRLTRFSAFRDYAYANRSELIKLPIRR